MRLTSRIVIKPISSGVPITQRIRQCAISKLVNPAQQINASTSNITNLTAAVGNPIHGKAGPFVKPVNARSRFLPDVSLPCAACHPFELLDAVSGAWNRSEHPSTLAWFTPTKEVPMKIRFSLMALALLSASFVAHASCDDVKSSIDAKIKANNVSNYSLDVVAKDKAGDGKVVGQCDGGAKVIVYTRGEGKNAGGADAAAKPPADSAAPAAASSSGQ